MLYSVTCYSKRFVEIVRNVKREGWVGNSSWPRDVLERGKLVLTVMVVCSCVDLS